MDIIRFTNPTDKMFMEQAFIVNDLISKMWIERYREAGEFTLTGRLDSGIRSALPIGSFISHVNTSELMIVENHELTDDSDSNPIVTVTGRSFETFLEKRAIITYGREFPTSDAVPNYVIPAHPVFEQAFDFIQVTTMQIENPLYFKPTYWLTNVPDGPLGYQPQVERVIKRGQVYPELLSLLAVNNLGIKSMRPKRLPKPHGGTEFIGLSNVTYVMIYDGIDRSESILFAHATGEIEQADYLWSNKPYMNSAFVAGKWVDLLVGRIPHLSGYEAPSNDIQMLYVDATDIDQDQSVYPTGTALAWIRAAMRIRGLQALASQNQIALSKIEVSKDPIGAKYRRDYDLGDIVSVSGNYGLNTEAAKMRVTEYVEIEDDTGTHAYPTLEFLSTEVDDESPPDPPEDPPDPPDITPPGEVTDLNETHFSTSIELSWTNPSDDFVGVMIRRTLGYDPATSHTDGTLIADLTGGETMYTDTGLTPLTRYCYNIFAYDSDGNFNTGLSSISVQTLA